MAQRIPPDFQDDLNYVISCEEAAAWYRIAPSDVRRAVEEGRLVGRLSGSSWLVSVDALFELYGDPDLPRGRRRKPRARNTVNALKPEGRAQRGA